MKTETEKKDKKSVIFLLKSIWLIFLTFSLITCTFSSFGEKHFFSHVFYKFSYDVFYGVAYTGSCAFGVFIGYISRERLKNTWLQLGVGIASALIFHMTILYMWHDWAWEGLFGIVGIVALVLLIQNLFLLISSQKNQSTSPELSLITKPDLDYEGMEERVAHKKAEREKKSIITNSGKSQGSSKAMIRDLSLVKNPETDLTGLAEEVRKKREAKLTPKK